jgi:hypothetical protein
MTREHYVLNLAAAMGDIPPPNALYPQPVAPNQGLFTGDPSRVLGAISTMNQIQIQRQAQQDHARQQIGSAFSNAISGLGKNVTEDDVHNITANIARQFPQIATQHPDIIQAAKDIILNSRHGDINFGANVLKNSLLSGSEGSSRQGIIEENTGRTYSAPTPNLNMGGAVLTGLPPAAAGVEEERQKDLKREGDTYQPEITNLRKALSLAKNLPESAFGPNSSNFNDMKARLVQLGWLTQKQADEVGDLTQLNKNLQQAVQNRSAAFGPHTNAGLDTTFHASPNTLQTKEALIPLIKQAIAIRNMEHAAVVNSHQEAKVGEYNAKKAQFGTNQDPTAFAIADMDEAEVRALEKSLKGNKAKRDQFNRSYQAAIRAGIAPRPGE